MFSSPDIWFNIFPYLSLKQVAQCQRVCKSIYTAGNDYFPISKYRSINAACRDVLDSSPCSYLPHEILPKPLPLQKSQVEAFLRSLDQDPFLDVARDELKCILQVAVKLRMNDFVCKHIKALAGKYLYITDIFDSEKEFHELDCRDDVYRYLMGGVFAAIFRYGNKNLYEKLVSCGVYQVSQPSAQLWKMYTLSLAKDKTVQGTDFDFWKVIPNLRGDISPARAALFASAFTADPDLIIKQLQKYPSSKYPDEPCIDVDAAMQVAQQTQENLLDQVLAVCSKIKFYRHPAGDWKMDLAFEFSKSPHAAAVHDRIGDDIDGIHFFKALLDFFDFTHPLIIRHCWAECMTDDLVGCLSRAAHLGHFNYCHVLMCLFPELVYNAPHILYRLCDHKLVCPKVARLFAKIIGTQSCSLNALGFRLRALTSYHCLMPFIKFYQPTKNKFLFKKWMTVGEYLLSKTGANFDAMYYFHQEWKASFTLNVLKGWLPDYCCIVGCLDLEFDALAYVIKETKPDILLKFVKKQTKNIRGHKANNQLTRFQKSLILSSSLSKDQNALLQCLPFFSDKYVLKHLAQRCFDPEWIKSNDFMAGVLMMLRCCQRVSAFECVTKLLTAERWLALNIQGMKLCMKKSRNDFDKLVALEFLNWQDTWPAMPGDKKFLLEQAVEGKSRSMFNEWLEMH